ncbi:putative claudin-24 [Pygocentrus nattereri]|uniref:Claudin n=1 Tax=Pygocentrus nattereri TaxID=42514 RepID=A0A3B4D7M4_PYGNA|nr:putative claudin-24 [Pygocentrus nattereri]
MSNPCSSLLEVLGLIVGVGAWFCSLAATIMPSWKSLSTELLSAESYEVGLWETCVVQEGGATECREYDSLLGLSHDIMLARILMCLSDALALLGIIIAIPGLKQVKSCQWEEGWRVKRGMKITAGILFLIAGIVGLIPVSFMAHDIVKKFFDHSLPEVVPRFEFGDAMFVGWAAGFLHVVAAILFFASCSGLGYAEPRLVYHRRQNEYPNAPGPSGKRTEYV